MQCTKKTSKSIGTQMKIFRKSQNLSQNDFAKKVGVSHATISAYENNRMIPNMDFAKQWHEKYGVSYEFIFGEESLEEWEARRDSSNSNKGAIFTKYLNDKHIKKLMETELKRKNKVIPAFLNFLCSVL